MSFHLFHSAAACYVPKLDNAIIAARSYKLAVMTDCAGCNRDCVPRKDPDRMTSSDVPQSTCSIARASQYVCTIRMELNDVNVTQVTGKDSQWVDVVARPQSSGHIVTGSRKIMPERTEGNVPNRLIMTFVCYQRCLRINGPEPSCLVFRAGQHIPIVGTEGHSIHRSRVVQSFASSVRGSSMPRDFSLSAQTLTYDSPKPHAIMLESEEKSAHCRLSCVL